MEEKYNGISERKLIVEILNGASDDDSLFSGELQTGDLWSDMLEKYELVLKACLETREMATVKDFERIDRAFMLYYTAMDSSREISYCYINSFPRAERALERFEGLETKMNEIREKLIRSLAM